MTLRTLFAINCGFLLFFGLACLLAPVPLNAAYGLDANTASILTTRLLGCSFLGFAALTWIGWRTAGAETRRAIAVGLVVQDSIGLVASVVMQLNGMIGLLGWGNVFLYGVFALGYAGFLTMARDRI